MDESIPAHAAADDQLAELDRLIAADEAADQAKAAKSDAQPAPSTDKSKAAQDVPPQSGDKPATPEASKETPADEAAKKEQEAKDKQAKDSDSAYKKDLERRDRTWKAINEQKAALQKERDDFAAERQALQERVKALEATAAKARAEPSYTPEQYDSYADQQLERAKELESQGKDDEAAKARTLAQLARSKAREAAAAGPAPDAVHEQDEATNAQRIKLWEKAKAEVPELAQKDSEVSKKTREILTQAKHLLHIPEVPYFAAQLAKAQHEASAVPGLRTELEALRKRNQELEKLITPGGGRGPAEPPREKSFEEMSLDEQEASLRTQIGAR